MRKLVGCTAAESFLDHQALDDDDGDEDMEEDDGNKYDFVDADREVEAGEGFYNRFINNKRLHVNEVPTSLFIFHLVQERKQDLSKLLNLIRKKYRE